MNQYRNILLTLCALFFLSACGKDDNPAGGSGGSDNSFAIDGAGFNNRTFVVPSEIPPGQSYNSFAFGFYQTEDSVTYVVNVGGSSGDTVAVFIGFRGNQTRNFQGTNLPRLVQVQIGERSFVGGYESSQIGSPIIPNTSVNINVTRYEAVNGRIQGSYSGTLREISVKGGVGSASISIRGNFNVRRLQDDFKNGGGERIAPLPAQAQWVD